MAFSNFADSAKCRDVMCGPFRAEEKLRAANPGLHPGLSHPAALRRCPAPNGPFGAATRQDAMAQGDAP